MFNPEHCYNVFTRVVIFHLFISAFTADAQSATATADYGDFNPDTGEVTFTGTDTEKMLTIAIVSDTVFEETEQFQVKITVPTADGSVGDLSKATVTIRDNDSPRKF